MCILELGKFETDEQISTAVKRSRPKLEGLYRVGQHVFIYHYDCAANMFRSGRQLKLS